MAKKKRRIIEEPEEEYEFTPTEFNEREFILKEMYSTKIFGVAVVMAIIVGIVGGILINVNPIVNDGWYLMSIVATAISFGVMFTIKKVTSMMGLHPELIEFKSLAGIYLVYLALALGVCIAVVQFGNF